VPLVAVDNDPPEEHAALVVVVEVVPVVGVAVPRVDGAHERAGPRLPVRVNVAALVRTLLAVDAILVHCRPAASNLKILREQVRCI